MDGGASPRSGPPRPRRRPPGAAVLDLERPLRDARPRRLPTATSRSCPGHGDQIGQLRRAPVPQALRATANLRRDLAAGTTTHAGHGRGALPRRRGARGDRGRRDPGPAPALRHAAASPRATATAARISALRRGGRDPPRRARELPARRRPREDLRHRRASARRGTTLDARASTSREEIRAAVEEAERAGKYAAAHAHGGPGPPPVPWRRACPPSSTAALATDEDVALMIERRAWLICTFSIFMHPTGIEQGDGAAPAIMEKLRWARRTSRRDASRAIWPRACASPCGTDSVHGPCRSSWRRSCASGCPRGDALLAGTRWGAEACRIDARGRARLSAGKRARSDRDRGRSAARTSRRCAGCASS